MGVVVRRYIDFLILLIPTPEPGMSIWRYGAKMSATRIFLAPVRKRPAPGIRLGSGRPASSVGKARQPYFIILRVFTHTCIINFYFILLVERRRVCVVAEHYKYRDAEHQWGGLRVPDSSIERKLEKTFES